MSAGTRIADAARLPLVRSTTALVLNTGINGALGLGYWVAAARLYDAPVVGKGAGAVSGLIFVASLGWIGLQQVLLRYLPTAGARGPRLVLTVYGVAIAIALAAAAVFLVYASGQPELAFAVDGPGPATAFMGAVALWVVFSLQDPALIGVNRTAWVPLENLGFGVVKLGLLVVLAGSGNPWAILGSWALGASWLVIVVSLVLRRQLAVADPADAFPGWRRIVRFAAGQHAIAVVLAAPDSLVPLIVLAVLGDAPTAFYYAAWTVSFSLRLLAVNLANAMTAEGSRTGTEGHHVARQARALAVVVVLPAVVAAALLAGPILSIYGHDYAGSATDLLRLLAVAVIPFAGVTLFIAGERLAERTLSALLVVATATVLTLALDIVLLPRIGIVGAGWGWLAAQTVAAILGLAIIRRRHSPA